MKYLNTIDNNVQLPAIFRGTWDAVCLHSSPGVFGNRYIIEIYHNKVMVFTLLNDDTGLQDTDYFKAYGCITPSLLSHIITSFMWENFRNHEDFIHPMNENNDMENIKFFIAYLLSADRETIGYEEYLIKNPNMNNFIKNIY